MIELYAITDHPGPALSDVAPLRLVPSGSLAGVCGAATSEGLTPEALLRHERIVEVLMEDRDLLPVRYGTRFPDEPAVTHALEERRDELTAALDSVRGAVELAVRVLAQPGAGAAVSHEQSRARQLTPAGAAGEGTAYLRARMHDTAAESEAAARVHDPLRAIARDHRLLTPALRHELMRAAYLVDANSVDRFSDTVARLQRGQPSLLVTCTGPWPAYSFAQR